MRDDAALIREYATHRSDAAFSELVRRHVDLVYSVALRQVGGDTHSAQDVAQLVFIALSRQAGALMQRPSLAGWLYLTTHHQAAQFVRSDRRRQNREHQAYTMNETVNGPDIDWHQLRPELDEALRELGDADREAVLLRYFEQRPFADIGRALRLTEDAARMRVDRALEKLRTSLARRGVASTAAALAGVLGTQVAAAPAGLATQIAGAVAASAASGAGVGVGVATSFFLMHFSKIILLGVAAAAVGISAYFIGESRQRATDLAVAQLERDALKARVTAVESRLAQASPPSRAAHAPDLPAAPASAPASKGENPVVAAPPPVEERERKLSAEARQAEMLRLLASYDPLFKKLALSGPQIEAFQALLTANLVRHGDLREYARVQGARPSDPDLEALETQADAELVARIRATFGESIAAAYQYFEDTGPLREITHHLATALAATATPLTPAQAEQLVEVLAAADRGPDGRVSRDPRGPGSAAALAQAQTLLSPPQFAALREIYDARR